MSEQAVDRRFFPYAEPYPDQVAAMDRIGDAMEAGRDVLFEGACGTGKTLSALVPALEHARANDRTVVITTNVHQQMRQFVAEARAIVETEPIRAVVFRGKGSMCHIDVDYRECQVLRDATRELVETEREYAELEDRQAELLAASQEGSDEAAEARAAVVQELDALEDELEDRQEAATCDRYYRNLAADTDAFFGWLFEDVRTPDEIYARAEEAGLCGYELLKEGVEGVDLVVCNYHHLLDPAIREQFFRWLGRDPDDVVTVFDEAHNVERSARDHATRTLTEGTLDGAIDELREADDDRARPAINVLTTFRAALVATYGDAVRTAAVDEDWTDVAIADGEGRDDLTVEFLGRYQGQGYGADLEAAEALGTELDEQYAAAYRSGAADSRRESRTLQAARFLERWMDQGDAAGVHPVVSVRRDGRSGDVYGRAELYTCIPRAVTGELFEEVHASVLMSATLRPFEVTESVLGLDDPAELAYGLRFPPERRRTFAAATPPLFASERTDPGVQETVAGTLSDVVEYTPGTVLAFFPSYAEADRYADRLSVDAPVYLDEPATGADDLRETIAGSDEGVLLTSLWGTLTEGVSFDGDDARAVAVVGVPYPRLDDRIEAVQDAYAAAFDREDAGWRYAVEIPTIRKTRQALGRVIRSPEDLGVRVLLDDRYTASGRSELGEYSVHDGLPGDLREELVDVEPGKLRYALLNFFGEHDAYDGDPPSP